MILQRPTLRLPMHNRRRRREWLYVRALWSSAFAKTPSFDASRTSGTDSVGRHRCEPWQRTHIWMGVSKQNQFVQRYHRNVHDLRGGHERVQDANLDEERRTARIISETMPAAQSVETQEKVAHEILDYYQRYPLTKVPDQTSRSAWVAMLARFPTLYRSRIHESVFKIESLLQLRQDIINYEQSNKAEGAVSSPESIDPLHHTVRTALALRIPNHMDFRLVETPWPHEILTRSSVHTTLMPHSEWVQRMFDWPSGKRVFALCFRATREPAAILYVSLDWRIPTSLHEVLVVPTFMSPPNEATNVKVATFYSIVANLQPVMSGLGLGEHLIHRAVRHLQQHEQTGSVQVFVTLSPMPSFRSWLTTLADDMVSFPASSRTIDWVSVLDNDIEATFLYLADTWQCSKNEVLHALILKLQQTRVETKAGDWALDGFGESSEPDLLSPEQSAMDKVLLHMATYYICNAKKRLDAVPEDATHGALRVVPLDAVTRFHISNGAVVYRVRLRADPSETGWTNSFGVMVHYRYEIDHLSKHQAAFRHSSVVPLWSNDTSKG